MITQMGAWYVFGEGTNIGKTLFAAGLCLQSCLNKYEVCYTKPIQTGVPTDCDASFIEKICNHSSFLCVKTLSSFCEPLSPHRVSKKSHDNDTAILDKLALQLKTHPKSLTFVEGAGGVASPTLDGKLQVDMYRAIRLPVIFVGNGELGGISSTVCSIETAQTRGFEIACLLLFEGENENHVYLKEYYKEQFPVFHFSNKRQVVNLFAWYEFNSHMFSDVFHFLLKFHTKKIKNLSSLNEVAKKHIWWPFTQHQHVHQSRVIDSAYGDDFCMVDFNKTSQCGTSENIYDASASWWTQNLGHGDSSLALAAACAAGQYGHVMFTKNAHEPAVNLTKKLISSVGKNWASRVFFTDNGSTAIEVALKMAFRKSCGLQKTTPSPVALGLKGSYHGDTHAAMDAASRPFNNTDHWHYPRVFLLDYPCIYLKNRTYFVKIPHSFLNFSEEQSIDDQKREVATAFQSMDEFFSPLRDSEDLKKIYCAYIQSQFKVILQKSLFIGACLLEGVVQGSSGMNAVDPLFQRLLVQHCQEKNIPVILDEVFTGFWRLGSMCAASMLNIEPDIACYGKLLTGGLVPLAVVLAKESIFNDFLGDDLSSALLHGHSYTAAPVSCAVASKALEKIPQTLYFNSHLQAMNPFWDIEKVNILSEFKNVKRVMCLGSVLAIELNDTQAQYTSNRASEVIVRLQENLIDARPLGNVIYFLAGYNTKLQRLNKILDIIEKVLKEDLNTQVP